MTGGAGFANASQGSFKQNRAMRNNRTPMKDNPYAANNKAAGERNAASALEVQTWMAQKFKKQRTLKRIIWSLIAGVAAMALLFALF